MIPRKKTNLFLAAAILVLNSWAGAAPEPDPSAPVVGQLVARILEQNHYLHHPLDAKTSKELLANYLEMYDYNRMFFDKTDVDEFTARYGDGLADRIKEGDVAPAYEIFDRFLKRLEERTALVAELTASSMTFTADESIVVDRHESAWAASAKEVRELWRLRVKYELLQEKLNKTKPEELAKTVNLRYERLLRSYKEYDSGDILQNYLSALTRTFDPHSDYMAAPQKENFDISMRLSLVGIGAVLRSEDGYAKIVSLVPGGPADKDKRLKPNDKIEAIAQGDGPWIEAVGMKLDRLVQMIRGEKGTTVRLRVIPADSIDPGTRVAISLVRDEIKLTDQEAKAKIITLPLSGGKTAKVGVIDLPSFYADMKSVIEAKSTTRDVEKLLIALKKNNVDGVILDLRRNGGGSLSEAVSLTGLFIPEGPVVQVKDARGITKVLRDTEPDMLYNGPLIVLTSRASASASEILAAALQDYNLAVIVGEKSTFGKGTVQSIIELSQYLPGALRSYKPGAVKLTIQKFYRVSGGSTQNRGVIPEIHLPSLEDSMDIAESSLKNAMPYDETEAAAFSRTAGLSLPKLKELARLSAERVAANAEFAYVRADIERYKKQKEEKTISLSEKKRLAEKKADEDRASARKKERAARKEKELVAQEITLESIDGAEPPKKSTAAVTMEAEGPDYEKAPPTPDYVLEDAGHILADMMGALPLSSSNNAAKATPDTYIP
ncbi:MAG: carboxy terminal-processing peptidase [Elusimicrobia bacterium]|nr:carboxy terminal-processing peptidase [Elusimicrobiota bacterium]